LWKPAEVIGMTVPDATTLRINLISGFMFDLLSGWPALFQVPLAERKRQLADPACRARLREGARSETSHLGRQVADWAAMQVAETFAAANQPFSGKTLGELGVATGKDPFDLFCEIALADDLKTSFAPTFEGVGDDSAACWQAKGPVWLDDRTIIGGSDAGAHLDMIDAFAIPTRVLQKGVRQHGLLSLEQAIHQLSDLPARLYGLKGRGRIAVGWQADIVVFDADRIGCKPVYTRFDLPTGAGRLFADVEGIGHVLVNGVEIVREGLSTGELPGTILRSGRDTETVDLAQRQQVA
jgi:N-acyl-D-aspartate/D-glutamate deacylase